jgi:hypothetical protein
MRSLYFKIFLAFFLITFLSTIIVIIIIIVVVVTFSRQDVRAVSPPLLLIFQTVIYPHCTECNLPALYRILARHGVYINCTQHPNPQSPLLVFCNQIETLGLPYIWTLLASWCAWPHYHEHMLHCNPGCDPALLFSSAKLSLLCITWGWNRSYRLLQANDCTDTSTVEL